MKLKNNYQLYVKLTIALFLTIFVCYITYPKKVELINNTNLAKGEIKFIPEFTSYLSLFNIPILIRPKSYDLVIENKANEIFFREATYEITLDKDDVLFQTFEENIPNKIVNIPGLGIGMGIFQIKRGKHYTIPDIPINSQINFSLTTPSCETIEQINITTCLDIINKAIHAVAIPNVNPYLISLQFIVAFVLLIEIINKITNGIKSLLKRLKIKV
jgi:hypothetical protein